MIDKSERKATVERQGTIIVVRMTGGADCLWLNMYLDTDAGQMTCDSDIGFYSYHWGRAVTKHKDFASFCCEWLADEHWLLRKCIGEQHVPIDFDKEATVEALRKMYTEYYEGEDVDATDFEDVIDEANAYDDSNTWSVALQCYAYARDVELPEEWWECIVNGYTPWQKRFAEICREVIVPELEKLIGGVSDG